jgi:CRISPR-associated protein Cas2
MGANSKWYLICYDIHDPKRLRKAAKHLEGYGQRMQESVFRVWLGSTELQRLRWELTEQLDPSDDLLILPLCSHCVAGLQTTHTASKKPDWPESPRSHSVI